MGRETGFLAKWSHDSHTFPILEFNGYPADA
jgi:hypothetical protein